MWTTQSISCLDFKVTCLQGNVKSSKEEFPLPHWCSFISACSNDAGSSVHVAIGLHCQNENFSLLQIWNDFSGAHTLKTRNVCWITRGSNVPAGCVCLINTRFILYYLAYIHYLCLVTLKRADYHSWYQPSPVLIESCQERFWKGERKKTTFFILFNIIWKSCP